MEGEEGVRYVDEDVGGVRAGRQEADFVNNLGTFLNDYHNESDVRVTNSDIKHSAPH